MSILKAACIGIAGTFLALQFQNTRKEYGIYLGIAVSIFLFLGMSRNLSVIRETLELVGSFVKIDAVYLTAMLKILGVTYLAEFAAAICNMTPAGQSTVNTVAIGSGWTDTKSMFIWGGLFAIAGILVLSFIAYPLGSLFIS